MNEIVQNLTKHGYSVLFGSVFARQLCLPIPAILFLVAAGALARNGQLSFALIVGLGVVGSVLADLVWYEAGRLRGNSVVHLLHRFSSNSDSEAARVERLFARYGTKVLLISKFVIGVDALAPPLAGISGTSQLRFMSFDAAGAALWASAYAVLAYVFSKQLDDGAAYAERMGVFLSIGVLLLAAVFVGRWVIRLYSLIREMRLTRITSEQLKQEMDGGESPIIVDVSRLPVPSRYTWVGDSRCNSDRREKTRTV